MKKLFANWLCVVFVLLLVFIPIGGAWAEDFEESIDWGLEGAVTDTAGLVINILELTPETLGAYPPWGNWSWNSDGTKVVYQSEEFNDDGEICVINADGTGFARLTDNDRCDSHASFVWPNNSKIVFQRNVAFAPPKKELNTTGGEIWIMDVDGDNQTSLTQAHGGPIRGAYTCENKPMVSPDGTKVAFRGCDDDRKGGGSDVYLYVMGIDGTNPVHVAGGSDGLINVSHHVWAPNSQWIAFKAAEASGTGDARIFKVKADGTGLTKLSPADDAMPAAWGGWFCQNWPRWSPDGKWIATYLDTYADYDYKQIIIQDSNGANMGTVMAQDGDNDGDNFDCVSPHFSWSPDSNWIVYSMETELEGDTALCMSNINTGDFYQLTKDYSDGQARWSPDPKGKPGRILFKGEIDKNAKSGGSGLYILNLAPWALDAIAGSGRTSFSSCGYTSWDEAGIDLSVNLGAGMEEPFFIGALYEDNPTPRQMSGVFWDLYCPDPTNVVTATVGLYFNGYKGDTSFYWFNEDRNIWAAINAYMYQVTQGIYEKAGITYTTVVSITLTADSSPSLSDMTGTVFAAGTITAEDFRAWAKDDDNFLDCFVKTVDAGHANALPFGLFFLALALCAGAYCKRENCS
ncbi:MAG: PD40 domain-containing protein [Desulfatibacillum sp.]|nr:PD40 domain-containing protein [Desulfatibacillum sp.]